jgi:hypothetical protein
MSIGANKHSKKPLKKRTFESRAFKFQCHAIFSPTVEPNCKVFHGIANAFLGGMAFPCADKTHASYVLEC